MKTPITTLILLATLSLNVFAQQEIPMFFDNDLMLQTNASNLAAYSPDGSKIATVFGRGKVVIWDAATGRVITKLAGHSDQSTNIINDIVFSPNGRQLASCASNDSTVKIWDTTSGSLIRSIRQDGVSVISFSPDGNHIVGVSYSGSSNEYSIKIWNTANGSELRTLVGHTNFIFSVTYNSNGRQILTASNDRSIRIWDAGNGQILKVINSEAQFRDAIYSPNGRYIAVSSIGRGNNISAIRIFNAETGQAIREIPIQPAGNFNIAYSPDGRQLLFNTYDDNRNRIIKIFDPETGRELRSFNNGDSALAFSPDGQRILTASSSFSLTIENNPYGASYATFLDATTGRVTGTIGYGPLNVGARAYADLQIARFLADTAAVNRHEAVLQFIIGRGNATRAEIETFYRNNIRALISQVVDEEFNKVSFSFENAAKTRGYNSVLTRNLQTGYYEINCTGFFGTNTMQTKTFSGSTLDTLITQMRNNTADFDQACINAVRAQAALIPAVVYADWKQRGIANGVDGLELIIETITNFYLSPNNNTYNILRGVYARLFIMSTAERDEFASIVNGAFVTVLSYLNSGISGKVVNENRSEMASALTSDSRYRIFSTSYRSVR